MCRDDSDLEWQLLPSQVDGLYRLCWSTDGWVKSEITLYLTAAEMDRLAGDIVLLLAEQQRVARERAERHEQG